MADTPADGHYGWLDFESEPDVTGDGSGDPTKYILTIGTWNQGSFSDEVCNIVHRTCPDKNGVEMYPIDGVVADRKRERAQGIVDALNAALDPGAMERARDIEFQRVVQEGLVPKVTDSAVCVVSSVPPEPDALDVMFAVQLGVMILLDKPIITLVSPGQEPSEKLRLVSDVVVEADLTTDAGQAILEQALAGAAERLGLNDD